MGTFLTYHLPVKGVSMNEGMRPIVKTPLFTWVGSPIQEQERQTKIGAQPCKKHLSSIYATW